MILTTYDLNKHGPLVTNLAFDSKPEPRLGDIFQVIGANNAQIFVQFEPFLWESHKTDTIVFDKNGQGIWIRYFANDLDLASSVAALKVAVLDYLDLFYLKGVGIEFIDDNMDSRKFAELVHGFRNEQRFAPFFKLQWQPSRTKNGIRFIFQPKR